ncbi:MAG: ABC transporter substrate-binding protein [Actinomycetia bacterium]|nr:ABC transporter substrate-binding protein [Actinomycetes bacterium]
MPLLRLTTALLTCLLALGSACSASPPAQTTDPSGKGTVTVTDDLNRSVTVPVGPSRVAVMEWEGLVAKTLAMLGRDSTIVAVDPATKKDPARQVIVPAIAHATDVGSAWSGINFESLAATRPEVVFLEAWVSSDDDRRLHEQAVKTLEGLKIPVVVFLSPSNTEKPDMTAAYKIVDLVGTVYDRSADTTRVVNQLKSGIDEVVSRIPKDRPGPSVAIFASTAYVMGAKSVQNHLFATLLGARNVAGAGTFIQVSEEQLLAMDPDVLVVIGHEGYISVEQVKSGEKAGLSWDKLRDLRAIKQSRVAALGYDEWRATIETPIAVLKAAKVLYPDSFADVDVEAKELAFYRDVFRLDENRAKEAIKGQQYRADLGR